jgi:hypothetical protein
LQVQGKVMGDALSTFAMAKKGGEAMRYIPDSPKVFG